MPVEGELAEAPATGAILRPAWRGLWALYRRGMVRFFEFGVEALAGHAIFGLLFLLIFGIAVDAETLSLGGLSPAAFAAPGIVMMVVCNNAFDNAGFPILFDRMEGMMQDLLMAPLSSLHLVLGLVLGAVSSAAVVGAVILTIAQLVAAPGFHDPLLLAAYLLTAALLFAELGLLAGLWSDKWDQFSTIETFFVLPVIFLSGTFYSLESLPAWTADVLRWNPVYYLMDGARYAMTGRGETDSLTGLAVNLGLAVLLFALLWRLFARGYKLRS